MTRTYLTIGAFVLLAAGASCGSDKGGDDEPPPHIVVGKPSAHDGGTGAKKGSRFEDAEFLLKISFTRGERSRDSNAIQTHITVADDDLYFARTPSGRAPGALRVTHKMRLTPADRAIIEQRVRDLELMTAESVTMSSAPSGPHHYATAAVELRLDQREHEFRLSGVTSIPGEGKSAFAQTEAYDATVRLVDEISAQALRDLEQSK